MATVPARPPRFLGERVPMREQSPKEQIQEALPGYDIESSNGGYTAKAKPVRYLKKKDSRTKMIRRGQEYQYSSYVPHELTIGPEGQVQKEVRRGTYTVDGSGKIREWGVYDSQVTDYDKNTRYTYGTRDMKSGRETVRQTSSLVGGVYKEKRIIDQDSAEYERLKRTELQKELIREKGFTVRRTEEYAVAGMSKQQRSDYYALKAKQRSAQFSLQAKAQKIARMETEKFRQELGVESQKYAMDIVAEQEAQRPKTQKFWVQTTPGPTSSGPTMNFIPETPASPTTRTDMGDKLPVMTAFLPDPVLQEAPGPKTIGERYRRYQDMMSQEQTRLRLKRKPIGGAEKSKVGFWMPTGTEKNVYSETTKGDSVDVTRKWTEKSTSYKRVALPAVPTEAKIAGIGAVKFTMGVGAGVAGFAKGILPWNLPETVGGMVNPQTYRVLGQRLQTDPAGTTGEVAGAMLAGYGLQKGALYGKAKVDQFRQITPKGESGLATGAKAKKEFVQTQLPKGQEKFTGGIKGQDLKFAKTKTGKGQIESTVFSAKVVKDPATGKYVRTPEIGIIRYEIPGDPTRLGTMYKTKTYAYSGKPIKVRPEVQQPLVKPQVIATSKWLPGDVRPVVVKNVRGQPTPYVPDWTGGSLRPYRPGEFTLSTVYKKPGLQPSQASAVGFNQLKYTKTVKTPFGDVSITKPPTAGTQQSLPAPQPRVITIVKKPGAKLQPLAGSVKTQGSPRLAGPGSQLIAEVKPQKYATAGEVISGTLKVYPKTKLVGKSQPVAQSGGAPVQKADVPVKRSMAGLGLVQIGRYQPKQQPSPKPLSDVQISQPSAVLQEPIIKTEPVARVDVRPESLARYREEAIAIPDSAQVPALTPVTISTPALQTETVTELRTEQVLRSEPLFEQVTRPAPRTRVTRPAEGIAPERPPPPKLKFDLPDEPEKKPKKYKVEVREKGIFKKIGIKSTPEEAFKFGSTRVQETASASLRVTPVSGGKPISGKSFLPKKIFRESKKDPGVFVERRTYRIDKPGEKREITFKGIFASKGRGAFKL